MMNADTNKPAPIAEPASTWRAPDRTGMRYPEQSDLSGGATDCVPAPAVDERTADSDSGHLAAAPPSPYGHLIQWLRTDVAHHRMRGADTLADHCEAAADALDQMHTAIAAERERVRLEHARELVEAHREAFVGNIDSLSKIDIDAMDAQPLLMAVQNWDISTGRARELLRCWVLGTFKPDMLPECGDELFAVADEPRDAWTKLQAELSTLRQQLEDAVRAFGRGDGK